MVNVQRISKLEYSKKPNHKLKIYYDKADLVINCETKKWDIDLRGATDFDFEYREEINLTIYLENGIILEGKALVNLGGVSDRNFNLQSISELIKINK